MIMIMSMIMIMILGMIMIMMIMKYLATSKFRPGNLLVTEVWAVQGDVVSLPGGEEVGDVLRVRPLLCLLHPDQHLPAGHGLLVQQHLQHFRMEYYRNFHTTRFVGFERKSVEMLYWNIL